MAAKNASAKSKKKTPARNPSTFSFKQTINAPPAEVYRAFTHATALRDWLCDAAQAEARVGGRLYLWWGSGFYMSGEFTALEPGKKIVFTWDGKGEPAPTKVQVSLKDAPRNGGTAVTLTHSGVGSGVAWASTVHAIMKDWPESLANLASALETGIDLRYANRPRLGIFFAEFNPQVAQRLNVPAKKGILLEGTMEDSGARAAGLQKDDVIVKFDGKTVDINALGAVLDAHKAGDKVEAVFYRGGEKKTVTVELSRRPIPEVPATAAELAEVVRKNYVDMDAELAKMLEGVTEEEASHKAGAEWSLKELACHFIAMERDFQSWVADMLNDRPVNDDLEMRPNVNERLRALAGRFGTLAALLTELRQAQTETA
ncbi:MAG: SRPBCC domain-containing protein, partial [Chloroflexota bacterium]